MERIRETIWVITLVLCDIILGVCYFRDHEENFQGSTISKFLIPSLDLEGLGLRTSLLYFQFNKET